MTVHINIQLEEAYGNHAPTQKRVFIDFNEIAGLHASKPVMVSKSQVTRQETNDREKCRRYIISVFFGRVPRYYQNDGKDERKCVANTMGNTILPFFQKKCFFFGIRNRNSTFGIQYRFGRTFTRMPYGVV